MPTQRKTKKVPVRRKATPKKPARRTAARAVKGLQLRSVAPSLTVNNLKKSLLWYRDVLGFKVTDEWKHGGKLMGVELAAGGVSFYVGQDDWKKGRGRVKGEGFRLYCSTSQDVDELAKKIKARRGRLLQEPHDEPWGGRAFAVADPDGFKMTITKD